MPYPLRKKWAAVAGAGTLAVTAAATVSGAAASGPTAVSESAAVSAAATPASVRAAVDPDAAVMHRAGPSQSAAQVTAYWTPQRMRGARAMPLPAAPRATPLTTAQTPQTPQPTPQSAPEPAPQATPQPTSPPNPQTTPEPTPQPKPRTTPVSAPGQGPAVTLALDAATAPPGARSRVWTRHKTMPATSVGRLFFTTYDGRDSACTATVITAANQETIWTAGHCVNDGHGHWYRNFLFVPDTYRGLAPLGTWAWRKVAAPAGWVRQEDFAEDLAAISLVSHGSRKIQSVTGSQGYLFGGGYRWNAYVFGYPRDLYPSREKVDAADLRYCTGPTREAGAEGSQVRQAVGCDMGHGASGGPWLSGLSLRRGWGYIVGDSSTAIAGHATLNSPHLGQAAVNLYNKISH